MGFRTILPPRRIMPNLLAKSPREASGRPMSDAELDSKVRELAAYGALLSTLPG